MPPQQTTPTLTPPNIHSHQWSVDHPTAGDPHNPFRPYHPRSKSSPGLIFMLTSSTLPTDLNTNTWPISSVTATSHTKTSPISDNTPMSSGMKPPSNTISSNTMPFHYPSLAPKHPHHHHHPFLVPPPLTGKSPTSTPATQALSATSPTSYDKAASYPAHSTLPTIPDFLLKAFALPTTNNTTKANLLALSTIPGNSTRTPTPSSSRSWHGAPPRSTLLAAKSRP